jgi:hypothetical protein
MAIPRIFPNLEVFKQNIWELELFASRVTFCLKQFIGKCCSWQLRAGNNYIGSIAFITGPGMYRQVKDE